MRRTVLRWSGALVAGECEECSQKPEVDGQIDEDQEQDRKTCNGSSSVEDAVRDIEYARYDVEQDRRSPVPLHCCEGRLSDLGICLHSGGFYGFFLWG